MWLRRCRACASKVPEFARTCPSCGVLTAAPDWERNRYPRPWAVPLLLVGFIFAWHLYCLPVRGTPAGGASVKSINPFTNAVVVSELLDGPLTAADYHVGRTMAEVDLLERAMYVGDVWGLLFRYRVVVDPIQPRGAWR